MDKKIREEFNKKKTGLDGNENIAVILLPKRKKDSNNTMNES